MSEVSVRLTELRDVSEALRQSAYRLQIAVDTVTPIIDQSLMDALPASEQALLYQSQKAKIASMPATLTNFANNLTQAAADIESALDNKSRSHVTVHFVTPTRLKFGKSNRSILMGNQPGASSDKGFNKLSLDDYVSSRNRALFDELHTKQSHLKDKSSSLSLLINQRNLIAEDLTAVKNRIISFDGTVPLEQHPRVIGLQTQLDDLDGQIMTMQEDIDTLHADIDSMTQRLDRVAPASGAELDAIVELESAENPQWMKDSTFGCVNHVVDKMPLPNGVPRDALLWDDAAQQLPQYGISWGDTPLEGSVLQFDPSHPYADDQYGHVLYVESVANGEVWVTDNLHPEAPVKLSDLTDTLSGDNVRYLYFPWHTRA